MTVTPTYISVGSAKTTTYAMSGSATSTVLGRPTVPGIVVPEELLPPSILENFKRVYVGYKIEKQSYVDGTGEWLPLEDIFVDQLTQSVFYDTRIAYNKYYRYRMFTIYRLLKDGPMVANPDYKALMDRVIELAPDAADILRIYGTTLNAYWVESFPSPWKYIKIVDKRPPSIVDDFQVQPNSAKKSALCVWTIPAEVQRDISGYRVFRKKWGSLQWSLVFTGGKRENVFEDTGLVPNNKYVYAVQCVDMHGLKSALSAQWAIQINPHIKDELEEYPVELYQGRSEPIEQDEDGNFSTPNVVYSTDDFQKEVVAYRKITIVPDPKFPSYDRTFIIRVTSLDTGEQQDITLKLRKVNIPLLDFENPDSDAHPSVEARDLEGVQPEELPGLF